MPRTSVSRRSGLGAPTARPLRERQTGGGRSQAIAGGDLLFYGSGASSIQSNVPMQRFQRDMQVLANHAIMHAPTAAELYGRVLCGLEPNTPLY
jgi:3-hydroxy-9,10-secoandrosta-1,3,5(10)-triene-9,17-dione monooxygenase